MCGFVREIDRENEEKAELQAIAGIIKEHKQWAKTFGAALILAMQGDYSEVDKLARELRFEFASPEGEPLIKSEAFEVARKAGVLC